MSADTRRVPYDPTRASLYRPGEADDFFTRPGTWSDSVLCAELSRLSYRNRAERRGRSLARVGLTEQEFLDTGGTQALVAIGPSCVFVSFRGTDNPRKLWKDLNAVPVPWEMGGRVHKGFADYLAQVRSELALIIGTTAGRDLVFTGHSLGAAAATLALSLWPKGRLYSFGSPRVRDPALRARFRAIGSRASWSAATWCAVCLPRNWATPTWARSSTSTAMVSWRRNALPPSSRRIGKPAARAT